MLIQVKKGWRRDEATVQPHDRLPVCNSNNIPRKSRFKPSASPDNPAAATDIGCPWAKRRRKRMTCNWGTDLIVSMLADFEMKMVQVIRDSTGRRRQNPWDRRRTEDVSPIAVALELVDLGMKLTPHA